MNKFLTLFKITICNIYQVNKLKSKSHQKKTLLGAGSFAIISIFVLLYSGIYAYVGLHFLQPYHLEKYVPIIFFSMAAICIFMMTVYRAKSVLFDSDDNDMLFALPIPVKTILASRLTTLLLINYLFAAFIFIPSLVVYAMAISVTPMFWIMGLIAFLFLPFIPTVLAGILGYVIAYFSSKTKQQKMVEILGTFVLCIGIIVAVSMIQQIGLQFVTHISQIEQLLRTYGFVVNQMQLALFETNVIAILIYIAINLGVFAIFVGGLSGNYKHIVNRLKEGTKKKSHKKKIYKQKNMMTALLQREWKRYINIPTYIVNTGFGIILLVLITGYVLFTNTDQLLQLLAKQGMEFPDFAMILTLVSFVMGTCNVAASSISLEGNNLWILKSLPIATKKILQSKVIFNLLISTPIPLLCTLLLGVSFQLPIMKIVLLLMYEIAYGVAIAQFGLLVNLQSPNIHYTSEVQVVKQSYSSFVTIMVPIVGMMVIGGISVGLMGSVSIELISFILFTTFVIISVIEYLLIQYQGCKKFQKIV